MITIYNWFGYELTIKERYRLIKEAGFDGVLLWGVNTLIGTITAVDRKLCGKRVFFECDWEVFEVQLKDRTILLFDETMIMDFYSTNMDLNIRDNAIKFREIRRKAQKVFSIISPEKYEDSDDKWYSEYVTNADETFFMQNNLLISEHKKKYSEKE